MTTLADLSTFTKENKTETSLTFNIRVWAFGIVLDFEYPYMGIGLGPIVIRFGVLERP